MWSRHAVERAGHRPGRGRGRASSAARYPEGATGGNIARQIALRAGLPVTTAGVTVNRFCSSGLQTIAMAAQRVIVDGVAGRWWPAASSRSRACRTRRTAHAPRRLAGRAQARDLLADAADRRDGGQALQHPARAPGRVRRAQPAARGRGAGGRQVQRRDRADHDHDGRGRQGHAASSSRSEVTLAADEGIRADTTLRRRGEDQAGGARRRDRRRQCQPVLRRRLGLRGDGRASSPRSAASSRWASSAASRSPAASPTRWASARCSRCRSCSSAPA